MATSSIGCGIQLAIHEALRAMLGPSSFPVALQVPFTKEAVTKIKSHPYQAISIPPGTRTLLCLLTVNGRSLATLVSQRMTVTKAQLPTLSQSLFKGSVFDGYMQRDSEGIHFWVSDCLAFKGMSVNHLNLLQRLAGVSALMNQLRGVEPDKSMVTIHDCPRTDTRLLPNEGCFVLAPEMLGFVPGRIQPDTYFVCLDDVKAMLSS